MSHIYLRDGTLVGLNGATEIELAEENAIPLLAQIGWSRVD